MLYAVVVGSSWCRKVHREGVEGAEGEEGCDAQGAGRPGHQQRTQCPTGGPGYRESAPRASFCDSNEPPADRDPAICQAQQII
jgi:hypothetical protein